jgi:hypothetical protein
MHDRPIQAYTPAPGLGLLQGEVFVFPRRRNYALRTFWLFLITGTVALVAIAVGW